MDIVKNAKVGEDNVDDNEIAKRSPVSKKPNIPTRYFTSLHSEKNTWKTKQSCH